MAQNPLSGHTAGTNDGLRDGDHILSPSLTNLYEGVHGNGILLSNDTSYGNTHRNDPTELGGAVRAGSANNQVIVKPFEAILDGVLYDFGGGSETTLTFATSDSDILENTNVTALSASGKETLFIILATSEGLKYTQTAVIDTATGAYPSITGDSAEYLTMATVSSASNKQTLVLATVRAVRTAASTTGNLNISAITEVNDKRVFVRPSPVYFTPVESGSAGSEVGITDHTTLLQIHGSGEHGSTTTESGVLWQSYNADGDAHLYFSAKDSQSTRHTHLIGPTGIKTTTADADMTFTFDEAQVFVLTPSTTIDLDPSGNFPPGHSVFVSNVSASNSIEFDDVGATATISFTGACTVDETIVIIDTAGTSQTYTAKSSTTASSRQFINTNAATAATALKTCIEHANGHNGTITVTDNGSGTLTLTQATGGTAGNTIITSGLTNVTVTNFTGAGVKDTVSPLESCMFVYGESGAQAVLTVTTGNADVTTDEADEITLISTDGTSKTYFVTDTNAGGVATNTVLVSGSDIGSTTAGGSNAGKIAVGIATTGGSKSTQNALLVELKAAIEHANGHNGKITVSAVPVAAGAAQSITLTQATGGTSGNRTITETIDDITKTDFIGSGWQRVMVSSSTPTPVSSGASGNVQLSDGSGGFSGSASLSFSSGNLDIFEDVNNADVKLTMGTSATESMNIEVLNGASNKTAEEIKITTKTASGTANHGKISVYIDEVEILDIDDGGIDLASGKTFAIDGTDLPTIGGDNLNALSAGVIADGDSIVFIDSDDSNASKKEALSDFLDVVAGTVATTGLDRSGATLVVSDLHPVGVDGSANQLLTDDGDGTVTSESKLTFDGKSMVVNTDTSGDGAEDLVGLHVDFDRTVAGSGTNAHNDIGINLDVNSASLGTSSVIGMDIDVVGAASGTSTATGLTVNVGSADTNYAALLNGGNVGIGTSAPTAPLHILSTGTGDTIIVEVDEDGASQAPNILFTRTSDSPAVSDGLGELNFLGKNDAGAAHNYVRLMAQIDDTSGANVDTTEAGRFFIQASHRGTLRGFLTLEGSPAGTGFLEINGNAQDIDVRIMGDTDTNLIRTDASTDKVGIGLATPKTKLTVEGAITLKEQASADADTAAYGQLWTKTATPNQLYFTNDAGNDILLSEEVFIISLSDETSNLTVGDGKAFFNMPFAMTLTGVKATVNTAPTGATIIVDIEEGGSTILSTLLSIDASEKTSTSAASAAVISDASLADDAEIKFNIDQVGSTAAGKGLKVTLYGYRT